MRPRTRLLTRLFFRRFLDNDLLAPAGEMQAGVAFLLALLAAPGFFNLAWLLFTYSGPFMTPSERLLVALDHKYQFIASSMLVTAFATVVEWDALSIDGRDLAILGPLPVDRATLWRAKVVALLLFLSLFVFAVNVVPTIGFPPVWLSLVPIGFPRAVSIVAVHALTSAAAAASGFCAVLALRSGLRLACGPRLFRAVSPAIQFAVALALLTAFLLLPVYSSNVRAQLRARAAAVYLSPPMWFVGAYDHLTSRSLYGDPDLTRDSTWKFWEREHIARVYKMRVYPGLLPEAWVHPTPAFRTEAAARRTYLEVLPVLDDLAVVALVAFCMSVFAAVLLYFLAHVRRGAWADEVNVAGPSYVAGRMWYVGAVRRAISTAIPRRPAARATFFFTLQAVWRSAAHRVLVACFLAVGFAAVIFTIARVAAAGGIPAEPTPALLSLQLALAFFLLAGVRTAFTVPAQLDANWLFRAAGGDDIAPPLSGVRRAVALGFVLPLFAALMPLHAAAWGARLALMHALAGAACSLLLLEALLFGCAKIPFTSAHVPGNANLRFRWPIYLAGFLVFTRGLASVENWALGSGARYSMFLAGLGGATAVLAIAGRRTTRERRIVFEEEPDPAVVRLGLEG